MRHSDRARHGINTGLLLALAGAALSGGALAAPEPDPVPRRWELDVRLGPMRVATLDTAQGPRSFFYLTYEVTNTSGQDLTFAPLFELATDEGHLLRAGRDVSAEVTTKIISNLENPFLVDQIRVVGPILQGEANAKESIAIWPVPGDDVDELKIYAAGFSGETKTIEVDQGSGKSARVVLRKSLMTRYELPGDLDVNTANALPVAERRWIMR